MDVDEELAITLKLERIRLAWDYNRAEVDMEKNRLLQLYATFLTLSATAALSVFLEKDPLLAGGVAAGLAIVAAVYIQARLRNLPKQRRSGIEVANRTIGSLMPNPEDTE